MAKQDDKSVELPKYTEDEGLFRSRIIQEMNKARDQRNQRYAEFDDQTYKEYWETNAKAANAYIPPKTNIQDVRTTSGTTHEKENTLLSSILNYNFNADINAYDKYDMEVHEIGTIMEDMVKKSRKIEEPDWDVKKIVTYKELLDQGTVFVEDIQMEYNIPDKKANIHFDVSKLSSITWEDKLDKVYKFCSANLISGLNVYLGNIREFYLELQPYVIIRRILTRAEANSLYSNWERWDNVPYDLTKLAGEEDTDSLSFNNWTLEELEDNMVEEIKYYNKWENNFMIMLNGVMMLPVKRNKKGTIGCFPLSALTGVCDYPLSKGDLEPISKHFAYSKSIPSKTKVDQAIFDEMLKAIVLKTRKSYQPPMANNTGRALSKKIFYPGTIHSDINPDKLKEIGENKGVTTSEFNVIQFMKSIIDDKTVSPVFEGKAMKGEQTAREIVELKQQSMQKLGTAILGVMNFEKKLCKLRLYNIINYWTTPIDSRIDVLTGEIKNRYRTVSVDTDFEDGEKGQRVIDFTEEQFPSSSQIQAEESIMSNVYGKKFRRNYINPQVLKNMQYTWYIEIVPTEKNSSSLKVMQFEDMVQKLLAIFLPLGKMPNLDYIATRWAMLNDEDPNKLFPPSQGPMMPPGGMQMQQGGQQQGQQGPVQAPAKNNTSLSSQGKQRELPRPTLNQAVGATAT